VADEIILWRRLDSPGHEAARLVSHPPMWQLTGTAVFRESGRPCRLEYRVVCSGDWMTLHGQVAGWYGSDRIKCEVRANARREWHLNEREQPSVAGSADLDLAFSPATNLLAIRRLALAPGESATVRSAWLTFPELTLEPLEQLYRRTGPFTYSYDAPDHGVAVELEVDAAGFVVRYPGLWEREA
jgi:uncharacterized protein